MQNDNNGKIKHMWNDELGTVVDVYTGELRPIALYRHGSVYFQLSQDVETRQYIVGSAMEHNFNQIFGSMGYKRSQFIVISGQAMYNVLRQFKTKQDNE